MRAEIAAAAARLMAEDGIDDFALAKRKAARQLGAPDTESLPANDEIEAALREYRALSQAEEHPERILELRRVALDAMRALDLPPPHRARAEDRGPYEIDLQLTQTAPGRRAVPAERNIAFGTAETRRFSGDRAHAVSVFKLDWLGAPLRLSVFDPRDERIALKSSQAGRVMDRAGIAEVGQLLAKTG
jgi:hypothetical protein